MKRVHTPSCCCLIITSNCIYDAAARSGYFVEDVLKLCSSVSKLRENKALFLNEFIKAFLSVPFQNIYLLCELEAGIHVPTWEESKDSVIRGYGGLCYSLCLFMKYLLEALGYDVYFLHVMHLVVLATTLLEAIPLDFEVESPIYCHSYLEYKFLKRGGQILRMHRKGEPTPVIQVMIECIIDGWRRIFEFELIPRDLSYFEQPMLNSPFLRPSMQSCTRTSNSLPSKMTYLCLKMMSRSLWSQKCNH